MFEIGRMNGNGWGPESDNVASALEWYRRGAALDPAVARRLGDLFSAGDKTFDPDPAQALGWYQRAAAAGDPRAMMRVAQSYESAAALMPTRQKPSIGCARPPTPATPTRCSTWDIGTQRANTSRGIMPRE